MTERIVHVDLRKDSPWPERVRQKWLEKGKLQATESLWETINMDILQYHITPNDSTEIIQGKNLSFEEKMQLLKKVLIQIDFKKAAKKGAV